MESTTQRPTIDHSPIFESPRKKRVLSSERARELNKIAQRGGKLGKRGKDKATLTKEEVYRQMQEKILARTLKLTNAQSMLGLGTIKVFRIDAHYEMFGRVKKLVKEKPVIVSDDDEIIKVLDYEYGDGDDPSTPNDEYPQFYFVETKDANNQAIDSQLNRVFGKAKENLDVTSGGQKIAPVIVGMRIIDNSANVTPKGEGNIIDITPKKIDDVKD